MARYIPLVAWASATFASICSAQSFLVPVVHPASPHAPTNARAISDNGRYVVADQLLLFDLEADSVSVLPTPPGMSDCRLVGVTNSGVFQYGSCSPTSGDFRLFEWSLQGDPIELGIGMATAVTPDGVVCGIVHPGAFRWNLNDGIVPLGGLVNPSQSWAYSVSANGLVFAGSSLDERKYQTAVRWELGIGITALDFYPYSPYFSEAFGVSGDGNTFVGGFYRKGTGLEAFKVAPSGTVLLPRVDNHGGGMARCASHDGRIVAGHSFGPDAPAAAVWARDQARLLHCLLVREGVNVSGWQLESIVGVSGDGKRFVGNGVFNGVPRGFAAEVAFLDCEADVDHDGFVAGQDFDRYVQAFESGDQVADFDGNCFVSGADFDAFVQAFEAGC